MNFNKRKPRKSLLTPTRHYDVGALFDLPRVSNGLVLRNWLFFFYRACIMLETVADWMGSSHTNFVGFRTV